MRVTLLNSTTVFLTYYASPFHEKDAACVGIQQSEEQAVQQSAQKGRVVHQADVPAYSRTMVSNPLIIRLGRQTS